MLGDISQRFLSDAVERGCYLLGQVQRHVAANEIRQHSLTLAKLVYERLKRLRQTKIVDYCRVQPVRNRTNVVGEQASTLAQSLQSLTNFVGRFAHALLESVELHLQKGKLLADIVVQLSGNAPSFLFL